MGSNSDCHLDKVFATCEIYCRLVTIRYDTIKEFKVGSKAECDRLGQAHETKTKNAGDQIVDNNNI